MIFFIVSILSFVWRTGLTNDPPDPPGHLCHTQPRRADRHHGAVRSWNGVFRYDREHVEEVWHAIRGQGEGEGDGLQCRPEVVSDAVVNGSRGDVSVRRIVADVGSDHRGRERTRTRKEKKNRDEMMQTEEEKATPGLYPTGVDVERKGSNCNGRGIELRNRSRIFF